MASFVGWIDYDSQAARSALARYDSLRERDARDELGLGAIRDTFSDLLFPATSTIQTRLRYFLFVPWCFCAAANQHRRRDPRLLLEEVRRNEIAVIEALRHLGERNGVIGVTKGEDLQRMPSVIYWNGLQLLRMRREGGSIERWSRRQVQQDPLPQPEPDNAQPLGDGFDAEMPRPREDFLQGELDFTLTREERDYLVGRLEQACVQPAALPYNLFPAFLAHGRPSGDAPWQHPARRRLKAEARDLLRLAAAFARISEGAVRLYNFLIASLPTSEGYVREALRDRLYAELLEWPHTLDREDADTVLRRLDELPVLGALAHHRVRAPTLTFIRTWADLCHDPVAAVGSPAAAALVQAREKAMKELAGTSRFTNVKARERWSGSGGVLDYRWAVVSQYLRDAA